MNRIEQTFQTLKSKNEKALVGFVTAGDPSRAVSLEIIRTMCRTGIDILELGIPFSDPTADGPVIQRSSMRSLAQGVTPTDVLAMTAEIRKITSIPIILFGYYNPLLAYGLKAFYDHAYAAGADGMLVVDLPPEESDEMTGQWPANDLDLIRLIAPTTPPERMQRIAESASGFIYLVSKTGITGSHGLNTDIIMRNYQQVRNFTDLPVCVGFGISTPEDVASVAAVSEGVVIGSAFERTIEDHYPGPDLINRIEKQVRAYKKATFI